MKLWKNKHWLYDLLKQLRRTTPVVILLLIVGGVTMLGSFYEDGSLALYVFNKTFRYKSMLMEEIASLAASVHIGYFTERLGSPVFVNTSDAGAKEYVFVNKYFYVQAITDTEGQVQRYAVTTRDKEFNPSFKLFDGQEIVLGKSHFSDIECGKITSLWGAHDFHYDEEFYFGNPGNYQSFFFALNESGYPGIEHEDDDNFAFPIEIESTKPSCDDGAVQKFRKKAIINTYAVTAPYVGFSEESDEEATSLGFGIGPNYNQVRILPR